MYFFYFLAAFVLISRLNKSIVDLQVKAKWRPLFNYARWGIGIVFIVTASSFRGWDEDYTDVIGNLLGSSILLGLVRYLDKEPDFKPFRFYIQAHYPLIAVGFINALAKLIVPVFFDKWNTYFIFAVLGAFVWIYARWINSKKQREELKIINMRNMELDRLVNQRTAELTKQKNELQDTIKLLQATQEQLIQQEKLASLGELTAGIAHEIQNPLNFVNNFSEVSMELLGEMEEELNKGDKEEAFAIAGDIKQNLEKIIHHGKRADGIVKGMLQHSRASTGAKEPIDINALADEYLRLAYHGLRAKDKLFNAELITHFDAQLPKVNVIPQDIGRVFLNLFTNAFYATQQKQKIADESYKPIVEVTIRLIKGFIEITVKDNGTGIPDYIKDKIMQPFFTTKPTGEGTGLGLSLSYDIVVKGHGGKIDINTKESEFTEFIVLLPA